MSSVSEDIEPVGGGPVTFIARWRERAKIMSTAPGFRDSRLPRVTGFMF